jgi:hypothetical protein
VVEPEVLLPELEVLSDVEPGLPDTSPGPAAGAPGAVVVGLRTSGLPASALRAREVVEPARPSGEVRPLSLQALAAAIRAAADPNVIHLRSVIVGSSLVFRSRVKLEPACYGCKRGAPGSRSGIRARRRLR